MRIQIVTVIVGVSKGRGWILENLLEGLKTFSRYVDIHLNAVISSVPPGTDWGIIPECDIDEINEAISNSSVKFTIWKEEDLIANPDYIQRIDPEYPSTGASHSKVLEDAIWTLSRNFSDDFLLVMDYDSFFIPSKVSDFLEVLNFSKGKSVVFGCIEEEIKIKEIYANADPVDFIIQGNHTERIRKGVRSIVYLPRIHPLFILFTARALGDLLEQKKLQLFPLKTIEVFDEADYILYGDCGVFLLNSINKKTGVTWILRSTEDMPVNHYRGMTLKISQSESIVKAELENIKKLYYEDSKNSLGKS